MPEPNSRHTSLDSFLPQFAPPGESAHAASAVLNGHARSSPNALSNGHAVTNGQSTSNGSNGFAPQNGHSEANGRVALNGHESDFVDESIDGSDPINGQSDCVEQQCDAEQHIYLDDELTADFEELQAAAVDSVHGNVDLAESLLPASDPLASALALGPTLNGHGRILNADPGSYAAEPVAQIRATPAEENGALHQVADLPQQTSEAAASLGALPSSNGAAAPSANLAGASARPELEPHPATGSLFVPYLVTEIPHLRNRTNRKRSWWRRLLG